MGENLNSINTAAPGSFRGLRKVFIAALAAFAVAIPMLVAPAPAQAAATVTTRVSAFSAGPATVTKGKTITVAAQFVRLNGKSWAKTGAVTATFSFDPDGSAPNKVYKAVKSNSSGYAKITLPANVSGKWTVRMNTQGAYKATASSARYVKVVAAPKPAPKPTSSKPVSAWNCPSWAPIKGNASSGIYHMSYQAYYSRTKPEICFATEAAAVKAGYRKSKR